MDAFNHTPAKNEHNNQTDRILESLISIVNLVANRPEIIDQDINVSNKDTLKKIKTGTSKGIIDKNGLTIEIENRFTGEIEIIRVRF